MNIWNWLLNKTDEPRKPLETLDIVEGIVYSTHSNKHKVALLMVLLDEEKTRSRAMGRLLAADISRPLPATMARMMKEGA